MPYPHFLQKRNKSTSKRIVKNIVSDYNPLLGAWLIQMALMLNWHKPTRRNRWPEIFECDHFCAVTGLPHPEQDDDDIDEAPPRHKPTPANCNNILKNRHR